MTCSRRRLLLRADDAIANERAKRGSPYDSSSSGGRQLRAPAEALRLSGGNSTSDPAGRDSGAGDSGEFATVVMEAIDASACAEQQHLDPAQQDFLDSF